MASPFCASRTRLVKVLARLTQWDLLRTCVNMPRQRLALVGPYQHAMNLGGPIGGGSHFLPRTLGASVPSNRLRDGVKIYAAAGRSRG